jgi:hypothetical protein
VFSNPVKILPWTLPSNTELKEFSVLLCLLAHFLDALLAESLLHRTFSSSGSSVHLCTCSMPTWQSLPESSVILFPLNSQQSSFLCALLAHTRSMPTWQSFSELLRASDFYLQTLNRVLPSAPRAYAQCPPGRAPTESSVILSATVFQLHSLTS